MGTNVDPIIGNYILWDGKVYRIKKNVVKDLYYCKCMIAGNNDLQVHVTSPHVFMLTREKAKKKIEIITKKQKRK